MPEKKGSTVKRRVLILQKLGLDGQVDVNALSKELGVSEVTIRNDLTKLEEKKMLIRARGGAIKLDGVGKDFHLADKNKQHYQEKQRIGQAAAALVEDNDTIILDSGTTTIEIAKHLSHIKNLTVITNALNVANEVASYDNTTVIIPGGVLRKNSLSLIGAAAGESFKNYFCDKLFLAVDGFSTAHGLSTPNVDEAHLNRIMIEISKKVIVVSDSSKFLRRSLALIAPVSKVDTVVTDTGILPEDQKKLENAGIDLIVV